MMEGGDKEGVMDSLLEALQSGSAFSREGRKKRPARPAGGGWTAQEVAGRDAKLRFTGRCQAHIQTRRTSAGPKLKLPR